MSQALCPNPCPVDRAASLAVLGWATLPCAAPAAPLGAGSSAPSTTMRLCTLHLRWGREARQLGHTGKPVLSAWHAPRVRSPGTLKGKQRGWPFAPDSRSISPTPGSWPRLRAHCPGTCAQVLLHGRRQLSLHATPRPVPGRRRGGRANGAQQRWTVWLVRAPSLVRVWWGDCLPDCAQRAQCLQA